MLLIVISCHHNRLKTNEKELAKEIKNQESEIKEAERIASENHVSDTLVKTHGGFFYKEDRSVDLKHPPVVIDFSKEIPVRKFKLSNIASKVRYLVLQVPDDSNYFSEVGVLNITLNNIITSNIFGIQRFSRDGKFIETICKSIVNLPKDICSELLTIIVLMTPQTIATATMTRRIIKSVATTVDRPFLSPLFIV